MAKEFFVGNTNNIAKKPLKIYVGNTNNVAKEAKFVFVGNSSNQAVRVYPNKIPETYQQIEYILNSGHTQYIDIGVKPNSDTRIELTFKHIRRYGSSTSYQTFYTVYGNTLTPQIAAKPEYYNSSFTGVDVYFGDGGTTEYGVDPDVIHILDLNRSGGQTFLDNELIYSSTSTFADINFNLALFGFSNPARIEASTTEFNVYHLRVWKNNLFVRDMYPCYLKSDVQQVGMYDIIGSQFYGNSSGTGIFYKGPDVN